MQLASTGLSNEHRASCQTAKLTSGLSGSSLWQALSGRLPGPCSHTAMLSQPCSRNHTLNAMLSTPSSRRHARRHALELVPEAYLFVNVTQRFPRDKKLKDLFPTLHQILG